MKANGYNVTFKDQAHFRDSETDYMNLTGRQEKLRNIQNKSAVYPKNTFALSPPQQNRNRLDMTVKGKPRFFNSGYKKNDANNNDRYLSSKQSSRVSTRLAKSFMKSNNVNHLIARELNNTQPIHDLKSEEGRRSRGNSIRFNNDRYLKAVKDKNN